MAVASRRGVSSLAADMASRGLQLATEGSDTDRGIFSSMVRHVGPTALAAAEVKAAAAKAAQAAAPLPAVAAAAGSRGR